MVALKKAALALLCAACSSAPKQPSVDNAPDFTTASDHPLFSVVLSGLNGQNAPDVVEPVDATPDGPVPQATQATGLPKVPIGPMPRRSMKDIRAESQRLEPLLRRCDGAGRRSKLYLSIEVAPAGHARWIGYSRGPNTDLPVVRCAMQTIARHLRYPPDAVPLWMHLPIEVRRLRPSALQ